MEVAQYLIVAIGSALFGGMVGYKWGRETGRNEQIGVDVARRVDDDHRRLMLVVPADQRCVCVWTTVEDCPHGIGAHVCVSPQQHAMEHRCACGALYPS